MRLLGKLIKNPFTWIVCGIAITIGVCKWMLRSNEE